MCHCICVSPAVSILYSVCMCVCVCVCAGRPAAPAALQPLSPPPRPHGDTDDSADARARCYGTRGPTDGWNGSPGSGWGHAGPAGPGVRIQPGSVLADCAWWSGQQLWMDHRRVTSVTCRAWQFSWGQQFSREIN